MEGSHSISTPPKEKGGDKDKLIHTPMSERQQLAIIKQMENGSSSSDCSPCLASPPRTPLGVLNGPERGQVRTPRTPLEERNSRKVSKRNHRGETALHCAAIKGNSALVRKLLRLGADPNTQDNAGWTPLHEASNRGNVAVARLLIQHGADIDYPGFAKETPLHDAARNGHVKVVRLLVKSGANASALNAEKRTPLQVAENKENPCTNPLLPKTIQFLKGENVDESSGGEESDGDLGSLLIDESIEGGEDGGSTPATRGGSTPTPRAPPTGSTSSAVSTQGKAATGSGTKGSSKAKLTYGNPGNRVDMSTGEEVSSSGQTKEDDPYEFKTSSKEPTPASSRGSASPAVAGKEYEAGDKRGAEEEADEEGRRKKRKEDGGTTNGGRGRGVRGNSTEKTVGKPGGRGRGSAGADRKSPNNVVGMAGKEPNASPAPSPGKGRGATAGAESDSDGDKREGGPKVPPLKIVINSGNSSRGRDERGEGGDGKKTSYIVNNTGSEEGESSEGKGNEGESSEGGDKASSGGRFTRSRANAPGGEGEEGEGEVGSAPSEPVPSTSADGARKGTALSEREDYLHKKRKLRSTGENGTVNSNVSEFRNAVDGQPLTDIEKHLNIRKQIEQRRKNLFPVQPKPPQGFKDYLMNKKTYHLQGNMGIDSRIQPIPKIAPPPSLEGPLRELFLAQENERYKLRMKHLVEKEKLVLAVEQEILRVHGRAARALANQSLPYSVCTILRDEEVYTPIDPHQEENNRDIRSRYNGRLFLSWLQDVDDKWEKIKEQMVLRHHNEAESLNAVQKMDWEWKLQAINRDVITKMKPTTDDLHVPMVQVNEDFDQLLS